MDKKDPKQKEKIELGSGCYLNRNCWLVKNLNNSPYKRCQYCEQKFHKCLFLQYQVISMILILFSFGIFFFIDKSISTAAVMIVFLLVIVYGYFFNNSTEKIIKSNFLEKKSKEALRELSDQLEERVSDQTKDIKEKNEHLQELLNMKGDFLRVVNHQLNTPLSIMRSAFSMMEEDSIPIDKGMEIASKGLSRMASTISEFWDAFELEGQTIKMNIEPVDIEKIINTMIEEKKNLRLAIDRKIKIKINKPKFKIPLVLCDLKKIVHVVSNLLDNAIFYTSKGSVSVDLMIFEKNKKKYLKVLVSDTGAGIGEDDKKRLFTKFYRGSQATGLNPDGSGLGLYIAKKVIEDSGGKLILEKTKLGKGTTFSFSLPVAKKEDSHLNVNSSEEKQIEFVSGNKNTNRSILLIEDESNIVDLYHIYFKHNGYNFYSTQSVEGAIDMAQNKKIDIVLLDIIIPKKEKDGAVNVVAEQGYNFLAELKKNPKTKNIPVVMFTNLNTEKDRKKSAEMGASGYIFKGGTAPKELLKEIEKILSK